MFETIRSPWLVLTDQNRRLAKKTSKSRLSLGTTRSSRGYPPPDFRCRRSTRRRGGRRLRWSARASLPRTTGGRARLGPASGYGYGGVLGGAEANVPPSGQVGVLAADSGGGHSDIMMPSAARESPAVPPDKRAGLPLDPVGGSDTAVALSLIHI